jgi:hypothetical protein
VNEWTKEGDLKIWRREGENKGVCIAIPFQSLSFPFPFPFEAGVCIRDRRRAGPVPVFSGPGPENPTFSDPPGFSGLRFFPVLPGPGPDCLPSEFSGFLRFFPGFSGLNFMSYSLKFDSLIHILTKISSVSLIVSSLIIPNVVSLIMPNVFFLNAILNLCVKCCSSLSIGE